MLGRRTPKLGIGNVRRQIANAVSGRSPETVAMIVSVGLVLGVFPIAFCPSLSCAMAAIALRLNLPAIQIVNQLSSPLRFALFLPLGGIGARIWHGPAAWSFVAAMRNAVVGWLFLCVPLGIILYIGLVFTLRRLLRVCGLAQVS